MPERSDVSAVERFHRALVSNDRNGLRDVLAEGVEWHGTGRSPFAGSHTGVVAVVDLIGTLHDLSGGTFRPLREDSGDVCASEYHAVLMDRYLASRAGKELDTHLAFVVVTEGGKVTLLLPYFYDQYGWDDFWS